MDYQIKQFSELTAKELLEIVQLRIAVFVVEQNCPYQEVDEWDETAVHIWLEDKGDIAGYTRIVEKGDKVTFGRVIISKAYRGKKLGQELLEITIAETNKRYPDRPIFISAQAHLTSFYEKAGFKAISEVYLEDDIPHVEMVLK